jgi:hypothetical protein
MRVCLILHSKLRGTNPLTLNGEITCTKTSANSWSLS